MKMYPVALSIFCAFFALVTVAGFMAARWRRPDAGLHSLEEWGLAGRSFGTFITWFLLGGDVYTAYTVIAVPAAMFGVGAMGFFAVPYTILIYPYMMVVLPKLWTICHRHNYVTFADLVRGRFGFRPLTIAIAVTGILALMPYIALQLVGMKVALAAMGLRGEWPLILAFMILAFYTYSAGLRAPAMIAVIKDVMLYVMVIAAVVILPAKVGGFAHVFAVAKATLPLHSPAGSLLLRPGQLLPYSTLAIGSTLALILYPHTATAVLSSSGPNTLRRNAALLPAYSLLLGMLALLGYVAIAAGINSPDKSATIPLLFLKMFPEWFAGFCLAAIAIGALVPAAIMSIAAANLFTRQPVGRTCTHTADDRKGSGAGKDRLHGGEGGRACLCLEDARLVRHRNAIAWRHLDHAALSRSRVRCVSEATVASLGGVRRMGGRHGCRHRHGDCAGVQRQRRVSAARVRPDMVDVRGGARAGVESADYLRAVADLRAHEAFRSSRPDGR